MMTFKVRPILRTVSKVLISIAIYTIAGTASIYIIRLLPSVKILPPGNSYLDQNELSRDEVVNPKNLHFVQAILQTETSPIEKLKLPGVVAFSIIRKVFPPFNRFIVNNFRKVLGDKGFRVAGVPIEDYSIPSLGDTTDYIQDTQLTNLKTSYNLRCSFTFTIYLIIFLIVLVILTSTANTIISLAGQSTRNTVELVSNVKQAFKPKKKSKKLSGKKTTKENNTVIKDSKEWIQ